MPNYAELLGQVCSSFTSIIASIPPFGPYFSQLFGTWCEWIVGLFSQFFPTSG